MMCEGDNMCDDEESVTSRSSRSSFCIVNAKVEAPAHMKPGIENMDVIPIKVIYLNQLLLLFYLLIS